MDVPITISSSQVQLRVRLENEEEVNWDKFRRTLRVELGCLCSWQWNYKMATNEEENGEWIWRPVGEGRQIHHSDTWVLALDLSATINRCKKYGAKHTEAVKEQIERVGNDQTHQPHNDQKEREDNLGEPAQTDDLDPTGQRGSHILRL